MRSTQESGQILRSKKRPRRTLRSGRGSRTNSNTSRQIPARVIDAAYDTLPAAGAPDLCQCRWAIITADVRRFGRLINKESSVKNSVSGQFELCSSAESDQNSEQQ